MSDQSTRDIANLKLQMDALQKAAETVSLPEAVKSMRSTVKWSAIIIAVALVVSSVIRLFADTDTRDLRRRIEVLEKHHAEKSLPIP